MFFICRLLLFRFPSSFRNPLPSSVFPAFLTAGAFSSFPEFRPEEGTRFESGYRNG